MGGRNAHALTARGGGQGSEAENSTSLGPAHGTAGRMEAALQNSAGSDKFAVSECLFTSINVRKLSALKFSVSEMLNKYLSGDKQLIGSGRALDSEAEGGATSPADNGAQRLSCVFLGLGPLKGLGLREL